MSNDAFSDSFGGYEDFNVPANPDEAIITWDTDGGWHNHNAEEAPED